MHKMQAWLLLDVPRRWVAPVNAIEIYLKCFPCKILIEIVMVQVFLFYQQDGML